MADTENPIAADGGSRMAGPLQAAFDPRPHLITLSRRQKTGDNQWKTIEFQYLPVAARVLWFRTAHPGGSIDAQVIQIDSDHCAARCEVRDEAGKLLGGDFGMCTADMWKRYPEKASTTSIGRALAAAGFGTQFCGDELDEGVADGGIEAAVDSGRPVQLRPQAANRAGGAPAPSAATPRAVSAPAPNGASAAQTGSGSWTDRPATEPQIKALYAISRGAREMEESEFEEWCRNRYHCLPAELTRKQASEAIDALKAGAGV